MKFHYEFPRIFDRIGFIAVINGELTIGFGSKSLHVRYEHI